MAPTRTILTHVALPPAPGPGGDTCPPPLVATIPRIATPAPTTRLTRALAVLSYMQRQTRTRVS